jgi:predicted metalloprotease with PDZ domain
VRSCAPDRDASFDEVAHFFCNVDTAMDEPVEFRVTAPNPDSHLLDITMRLTGVDQPTCQLEMPVWTPGSYLIREYPQHLQRLQAREDDGLRLSTRKLDKATWEVRCGDTETFEVNYQIYAHDLGVRSKHLDDSHGFFNATAVYLYPQGHKDAAVEVVIEPPESDWNVYCPLESSEDTPPGPGAARRFRASDFDALFDAPVEMGNHDEISFDVDGIEHDVVFWGDGNWDADRLLRDMPDIVEANRSMFGDLPYDDYLFLTLLSDETYGGLEHRNSTALIYPSFEFGTPPDDPEVEPPIEDDDYLNFLSLVAHEHFHVWNVKRIHPTVLDDVDYQREHYVRELWTIEGITSYYDRMALLRADLITPETYLDIIGKRIARLEQTPGRHVQSLEEAGFDAWIKYYRRDEQTSNATVNYYLKGALVAMLLDFRIRLHSDGEHSLDDLMRRLWSDWQQTGDGYKPGTHESLAAELAGRDLTDFFDAFVRGTDDIDWAEQLGRVGLEVTPVADDDSPATWMGVTLSGGAPQPTVDTVQTGSPARDAGIHPGDALVAIDGWQLTDDQTVSDRLDLFDPGDVVDVQVFRRQQLQTVELRLAEQPADSYELTVDDDATDSQLALLSDWLETDTLPDNAPTE